MAEPIPADHAGRKTPDWRLVVLVALMGAAYLASRLYFAPGSRPLFQDTDDAMRMVTVRDLLAGQGWLDLTQHRLNTPYGAELHWSRLLDAAIGGVLLVLRPLLGSNAETVLGYLWPALLLVPMVWLGGALSMRLAGPGAQLPGLALPLFSPAVQAEFVPGRLDHHNIQILLALALALATLNALRRPGWAIAAGFLGATGLAIGIEALPLVIAAAAGLGLAFVLDARAGRPIALFGASLALFTALHLAIARPPSRWLETACDMNSATYVVATLVLAVALALLALPMVARRGPWMRLLVGGALGLASAAFVIWLFPTCREGPYGMLDPWLIENWIDRITEARPLHESIERFRIYVMGSLIPTGVALAGVLVMIAITRAEARRDWLVYGLMLAIAIVLMFTQIRAARLAAPLAVAGGAGLIVAARMLYLRHRTVLVALPMVLVWLASAGTAVQVVTNWLKPATPAGTGTASAPAPDKTPCLLPAAFADLRALPPERILTPVDLGAHMLLETQHSVVAAPYHRNGQGVWDTYRVLNGPPEEARTILAARGIGLIVTCPAMYEMRGLASSDAQSLVRQLDAGTVPDWLIDQSLAGAPLRIYGVIGPAS